MLRAFFHLGCLSFAVLITLPPSMPNSRRGYMVLPHSKQSAETPSRVSLAFNVFHALPADLTTSQQTAANAPSYKCQQEAFESKVIPRGMNVVLDQHKSLFLYPLAGANLHDEFQKSIRMEN